MEKVRINFALTKDVKDILRRMADAKGVSMTALLEIIIREYAQKN